MNNNVSQLKIALTYISIFLLVVLIAIPPIFRIVFKDSDSNTSVDNSKQNKPKTVLHCTRKETIGTLDYNIQVFNTYSDNTLEKVIIRYNRTGTIDDSNKDNLIEQEITTLSSNTNFTQTSTANGAKFEINESVLKEDISDPVLDLYTKDITSEQELLGKNNYVCQLNNY